MITEPGGTNETGADKERVWGERHVVEHNTHHTHESIQYSMADPVNAVFGQIRVGKHSNIHSERGGTRRRHQQEKIEYSASTFAKYQ